MSDLTTLHWLLVSAIVVIGTGALCFLLPIASHRMLRPRRKRLLDDDIQGLAEAGHAVNEAHKKNMKKEKERQAALNEEEEMRTAAGLAAQRPHDAFKKQDDREFPERLLMTRVVVANVDQNLDGMEGIAVNYDKRTERYMVVMSNGQVTRIGIDELVPVNSIEVLTIKVMTVTDVRMREEAQARVQGRINPYMVLTLGERHMRTRIMLDTSSPRFEESFHCVLDRTTEQTQLLSMQVFHHNANIGEDVRLGIAFFSVGELPPCTRIARACSCEDASHAYATPSNRASHPQDLTAWPAVGGYMALANTLLRDQRWMRILSKLQPKLANFTKSRADDSPERVMMLLQSSPVLSAYGYITSGATLLSVPEGLSIANASLQHRLVDLEITMDHEQAYPHTQPAHPPLSTIDRHLSRVRPPCPTFHPVIARCRHSPSGAVRQYSEASGPLQPPSH
ncbi:MAG: hypothetical protein SGPRY_002153 [Prymnesium sp.]